MLLCRRGCEPGSRQHREIAVAGRSIRCLSLVVGALVLGVAACAPASPSASSGPAGSSNGPQPTTGVQAGQRKVLNLGLNTILDGFSVAASSTTQGGGLSYIEIHSQALFTADKTSGRPIPRLLAEQPSIENGGLKVTDDGKMIATYKLRPDVQWADGQPFTTDDLLFTFRFTQDPLMPFIDRAPTALMESASAPDASTFVISYRQPYYLADALGLRAFWPLPAHLLQSAYETDVVQNKDAKAFLQRPYWNTDYVHVGPFKLTQFSPGEDTIFDAVPNYFLGRPKVDRIVVKQYPDVSAELAAILSGAVDLGPDNALQVEQGVDLKQQWDQNGGGHVYFATGTTRFLSFQFDSTVPNYQPAIQDQRVRQALYEGLDRDAIADAVSAGIPDRAANELLPSDNPLYSYVKGAFKEQYPYDQNRAIATFESAGWRRAGSGMLANAAGAPLSIEVRTQGDLAPGATAAADMWKRIGVDSQPYIAPAELTRDANFRQQFPGVELTARGSEDSILTRLECIEQPTPQNHFAGNNRGHWCNQDYERLVTQYRTSLQESGQGQAIKQIQDLVVEQLPLLPVYVAVDVLYARKGVTAFQDDFAGGADSGRIYGTFSRNAHEWDIVS